MQSSQALQALGLLRGCLLGGEELVPGTPKGSVAVKAMSELPGAPLEPGRSRLAQHPRCLAEDPRLCAGCSLTSVLRAEVAAGFTAAHQGC